MSHRLQITLTDAQYARLRSESRRTGISLAALIRQAVDGPHGGGGSRPEGALDESFGAWDERDADGKAYVERLRPGLGRRLAR